MDLAGDASSAQSAYSLYRRAADAGLPEAEFNVAVMLDSGRGIGRDVGAAATWYARAASHGESRAAYNLGQLYEAGQGVPQNADLARAWFAASGLPAARERLGQLRARAPARAPATSPSPVSPASGEHVRLADGSVELVWTVPAQAEPVSFTIELRHLDANTADEVFSGTTPISSQLVKLPDQPGDYAWRVLVVAPKAGRYAASEWTIFQAAAPRADGP